MVHCNTIIALLELEKENCYRPERPMKPVQVLFDESGENVEDKRKREKKKNSQSSSGSQESRGRGEAVKSHLREPDKKRKELKEAGKYKMPCRNWLKHAIWE